MSIRCPKCDFENPTDTRFCGNCAAPLHPSGEISSPPTETIKAAQTELTRGSTFAGRYEIIEELGKGGMGRVYRGLDKKIDEEVALKLLKPEIAADKDTIERFRNELKMARKIAHRNVCRMFHLGEEEGAYYITMEYVPGEDLKSMIGMIGQLSAGKAIFTAKQVCEGLAEAHRLGVVHRDLKPQNIMIDREGNARIMDFGIARSLKGKGITDSGVMIGTPEYMSPEQVEGKEADQRSDIYSLGVILYEMLTGRVPFEGDTPLSVAVKHKIEKPKDPKEFNAQIPEDLSRVVLKCLEKNKENRYQSAGEVRSELSRIEKGIPSTERVIPKKKPITSKEITVTFGLKKLFLPALVIIAIAVMGVIIWQLLPEKEAFPIPSGKPSLAVMYFKNNTGEESLDIWRSALSDSIITDLSQSKHIKVLSGDRLYSILSQLDLLEAKSYSSEDLIKVASRAGVNHILQGNYSKAGDTFRIEIVVQDMNKGELIGSERVEGAGETSIFSMVDDLTKRIKTIFQLSEEEIAGDLDREIGKITTGSPEAYKYYSEGRKYHNLGDNRKAIEFYEKAVAADPEFAMAYRSLSATYSNLGYFSEDRKYLRKALEFADRVSVREKYLIQGEFYWVFSEKWNESIEAFKKLLELYPDDIDGNNLLGLVYASLEEFDKAIERFEVNFQNKVEFFSSYTNLAFIYRAKGLYDKAKEVLESYLNNFSDSAQVRQALAANYLYQGKYDFALVEAEKAFSLDPTDRDNFLLRGAIYSCTGELNKAEKDYQEYRKLLGEEESIPHLNYVWRMAALYLLQGRLKESKTFIQRGIELANKHNQKSWESDLRVYLAHLQARSGNPQEALQECDKAWRDYGEIEILSGQRFALYIKGLTYLKMKSIADAQSAAKKLKELIDRGMNRKEIRYYLHLMGMIELERENFSRAIEYFKEALSLMLYQSRLSNIHAVFVESLALAYYRAGETGKAQEEYEKIESLSAGRFYYGDIYVRSFYMLGKIYQEKGWKGKAIEHYEKFFGLWKEADSGITEISDAKKQLTAIQSE